MRKRLIALVVGVVAALAWTPAAAANPVDDMLCLIRPWC
jgi:hypothetical protein